MTEEIETGFEEAFAAREAAKSNPVASLILMLKQNANLNQLLVGMNKRFAVVKYGGKTVIASIVAKELEFMKLEDFHNLLANLVLEQIVEIRDGKGISQKKRGTIVVSKRWMQWENRRQYAFRGVVFEPGGPLEVQYDMLNLWRGYGVEPKQGNWSLMREHIREVICSGNEEHCQYLIRWMAYGVQHPDRPVGVAIALRGEEGAGKGFLWRSYGKLFGPHFKHIAHGGHLTGQFNAALGDACAVFLDEALWAGDRKGEQILKALVTEDTFQLERKFCDPIPVKNRLRIMIASNNQWIVPVGTRGRRYFVLDVSDQYADENDPAHEAYWRPLQIQFGDHASDDGRAAMLYDLLQMDLSKFNVLAVPKSAAKTEQKLLSLRGTEAWLFEVLQDSGITVSWHGSRMHISKWDEAGMRVSIDDAYEAFSQFAQARREYPRGRPWWSRELRKILKDCVSGERPRTGNADRKRQIAFRSLNCCREAFERFIGAPIDWDDGREDKTEASEEGAKPK